MRAYLQALPKLPDPARPRWPPRSARTRARTWRRSTSCATRPPPSSVRDGHAVRAADPPRACVLARGAPLVLAAVATAASRSDVDTLERLLVLEHRLVSAYEAGVRRRALRGGPRRIAARPGAGARPRPRAGAGRPGAARPARSNPIRDWRARCARAKPSLATRSASRPAPCATTWPRPGCATRPAPAARRDHGQRGAARGRAAGAWENRSSGCSLRIHGFPLRSRTARAARDPRDRAYRARSEEAAGGGPLGRSGNARAAGLAPGRAGSRPVRGLRPEPEKRTTARTATKSASAASTRLAEARDSPDGYQNEAGSRTPSASSRSTDFV